MPSLVQLDQTNISDFVQLYGRVFNAPPWNDGWSTEAVTERLLGFASFPRFYGCGLLQDGVAAALALGWGERWIRGWTFHLKEFCVDVPLQRCGLGLVLMQHLEAQLCERGYQSMYLQTGTTAPAVQFYQRLGYSEAGLVTLKKRL